MALMVAMRPRLSSMPFRYFRVMCYLFFCLMTLTVVSLLKEKSLKVKTFTDYLKDPFCVVSLGFCQSSGFWLNSNFGRKFEAEFYGIMRQEARFINERVYYFTFVFFLFSLLATFEQGIRFTWRWFRSKTVRFSVVYFTKLCEEKRGESEQSFKQVLLP